MSGLHPGGAAVFRVGQTYGRGAVGVARECGATVALARPQAMAVGILTPRDRCIGSLDMIDLDLLTPHERRIFDCLADAPTTKQLADALSCKPETVVVQLWKMSRKLRRNRVGMATLSYALRELRRAGIL